MEKNLSKYADMVMLNGRLGKIQNTSGFTCYTPNGQSVVDYVLCKSNSVGVCERLEILELLPESDHTPISFSLKGAIPNGKTSQVKGKEYMAYKWDRSQKEMYRDNIESNECKELRNHIITLAADAQTNIDEIVQAYYTLLDVAIPGNKCTRIIKSCFPRNVWYNEDCKIARERVGLH